MKKILALLVALTMIFALCACGSSDSDSQEEPAVDTTQEEPAADTSQEEEAADTEETTPGDWIEPEEVAEYYKFELEGKEYALPCSFTEFTDNGWYVEDYYLDAELEANTKAVVFLYPDSTSRKHAFSVFAANLTEENQKIADCVVIDFQIGPNDACSNSVTLTKSGVKVDISSQDATEKTAEAIEAAYGKGDQYSNTDMKVKSIWHFSERIAPEKRDGIALGLEEHLSITDQKFELSFGGNIH